MSVAAQTKGRELIMTDNMKKWLELVSANKELQEKLTELSKKDLEQQKKGLFALAKENGITLTDEDLERPQSEELSDDELDAVAGGGGCGCPFGGGGKGEDPKTHWEYGCGCIIGGQGMDNFGGIYCVCVFVGGGKD